MAAGAYAAEVVNSRVARQIAHPQRTGAEEEQIRAAETEPQPYEREKLQGASAAVKGSLRSIGSPVRKSYAAGSP